MHTRLLETIKYATGGHQADFAQLMGWYPQYLHKLLKGDGGIGIRPVVALLEKFPELNARWLLLGEGAMITSGAEELKQRLRNLLEIEQYMSVMTPEELIEIKHGKIEFDDEKIKKWQELLQKRKDKNNYADTGKSIDSE